MTSVNCTYNLVPRSYLWVSNAWPWEVGYETNVLTDMDSASRPSEIRFPWRNLEVDRSPDVYEFDRVVFEDASATFHAQFVSLENAVSIELSEM